ncbi:MAG: hypothetical protein PHE83_16690 [Opitutaceae bacterium]|nr:hypothetical protein [Opitutaceae bacterium]
MHALRIELIKPGIPELPLFHRGRWTAYAIRLHGPLGEQVLPLVRRGKRGRVQPLSLYIADGPHPYIQCLAGRSASVEPERIGQGDVSCPDISDEDRSNIAQWAMEAGQKVYQPWLLSSYPESQQLWLIPEAAKRCFIQRLKMEVGGVVHAFLCRRVPDPAFETTLRSCGCLRYYPGGGVYTLHLSNCYAPTDLHDLVGRGQNLLTTQGKEALEHFAARTALMGKVTS